MGRGLGWVTPRGPFQPRPFCELQVQPLFDNRGCTQHRDLRKDHFHVPSNVCPQERTSHRAILPKPVSVPLHPIQPVFYKSGRRFAAFPGQFSCSRSLAHSFRVRCLFLSNSSYKLESHVPQTILSLIKRSFMSLKYMCMPAFSATRCKHLSSLLLASGI